MKTTITLLFFVLSAFSLIIFSCKSDDDSKGCGITLISQNGENESHNNLQNCMNCHKDGGNGKGCFSVAGSAYDGNGNALNNGKVELWTGAGGTGTKVATVNIESIGNFFTTEGINFSTPLYPVVYNSSGNKASMPTAISNGACNSCHGVSVSKISVP